MAESAQSSVSEWVSGHVADAQVVLHAQHAERVIDRVAAFHADQRGDLAGLVDAHHVVDREGHLECIRIRLDHTLDDVDLFQRFAHGRALLGRVGGHIGRPELGADASLAQTGYVGVQVLLRLVQVDHQERKVFFFAELPRQVVMPVPHEAVALNGQSLVGEHHRVARGGHGLGIGFLLFCDRGGDGRPHE